MKLKDLGIEIGGYHVMPESPLSSPEYENIRDTAIHLASRNNIILGMSFWNYFREDPEDALDSIYRMIKRKR